MNHIIAVDFDGTLFTNKYPEIGDPKWAVIDFCKRQKVGGNKVVLWTCRSGEDLVKAINACKSVGLTFDGVNEDINLETGEKIPCKKLFANMYLDDSSVDLTRVI